MRDRRLGSRSTVIDAFARNPHFTERVERYCIARVDATLTVVEESSARLVSEGADAARLCVVSNTPPRARVEAVARRDRDASGTITIAYLGLLEVARGIGDLVEAMRILRDAFGARYRAIVVGGGRDADTFVARARELGVLDTSISFLGLLPHADALRTIAAADIGVIPHHSTELWNSTIPNKLFDYMAAGMPVVSSDTKPCARVIRETGCGEIFQSGNAQSMADAIARASSPEASTRMAAAGQRAVLVRYNWERETTTLLDTIGEVAERRARSRRT